MGRTALLRVSTLLVIVLGVVGLAVVLGSPDVAAMRSRIDAAGIWGPALFVALYAVLALLPLPKAVLTAAGGAFFGLGVGAGLSLAGALMGAIVSFGAGRLLGRDVIDRLLRGRLARADAVLGDHGLSAVLVVRLIPLVPFVAINYASGLTGVRFRHYVLGSALGMIPGSLAYAAMGAYGTDPVGLVVAASALVVLVIGGSWWARRLEPATASRADDGLAVVDDPATRPPGSG